MKQPNRIRVGYRNYRIEFPEISLELEPEQLGQCDTTSEKILVAGSLTPEKQANVLLHEVLHAIWNEYKILDDNDIEEKTVTCLANGLCLLIQENPETIKWIIGNLEKENNEK